MAAKKKAAKKQTRSSIDWTKLFALVRKGASNAEIAKGLGKPFGTEAEQKSVRAMVSLAHTKGVRIDGKLQKLSVPKNRKRSDVVPEPKPKKVRVKKAAEPKPAAQAAAV